MTRDAMAADNLAAPVGPFSLGVRGVGLFLSGPVAQDPATVDTLRVRAYWTYISDFAVMSQPCSEHFAEPYPARTAIGVAARPLGTAVEMDAVVG